MIFRTFNKSWIMIVMTFILACYTDTNQVSEKHLFYTDVKEAYKESNLRYNSKIENILYDKLPKPDPSNTFRISGLGVEEEEILKYPNQEVMVQTINALTQQFFYKVKTGGNYCPVEKIKEYIGLSPEERIGVSSGGYYRLFVAYWTLRGKLDENRKNNISKYGYGNVYYIDSLLTFVEASMAGAFFPTPSEYQIPDSVHRQGIIDLLDKYAPSMTVEELYEGADPKKVGWPIFK